MRSCLRRSLAVLNSEIGAPPFAGGFLGSGFASGDRPGGHYNVRQPHRPPVEDVAAREDQPVPADVITSDNAPEVDPVVSEYIEDPSRGTEYRFVPPYHIAPYENQWPHPPEAVTAVKVAPPSVRNRVRTNRYVRLKYKSRQFNELELYDAFGNHPFDQVELWDTYCYAHKAHALVASEYLQSASCFLHFVDPVRGVDRKKDKLSDDWVTRIQAVMGDVQVRGWELGVWHYTLMIQALARAHRPSECEEVFAKMVEKGIQPIQVTYGAMIRAYAILEDDEIGKADRLEKGKGWFEKMKKAKVVGEHVAFEHVWGALEGMSFRVSSMQKKEVPKGWWNSGNVYGQADRLDGRVVRGAV